jgi:hypothetical protein
LPGGNPGKRFERLADSFVRQDFVGLHQ